MIEHKSALIVLLTLQTQFTEIVKILDSVPILVRIRIIFHSGLHWRLSQLSDSCGYVQTLSDKTFSDSATELILILVKCRASSTLCLCPRQMLLALNPEWTR